MGRKTAISWAGATFNPWWGCVEVSPACDNCYARAFDKRVGGDHWGKDAPRRFFGDARWAEPEKWCAEAVAAGVMLNVFCGSMCDIGERRSDLEPHRARLIDLIDRTAAGINWLLLTKRGDGHKLFPARSNIWRGVTVERADYAWRLDKLRELGDDTIKFASCEPLLGPLADAIDLIVDLVRAAVAAAAAEEADRE